LRLVGVEIVGAIGRRPGRREWTITGVSTDSRTVREGELFFALPGERVDGHDFVLAALQRGAAAAVVSRELPLPSEYADRVLLVPDTLRCLGQSANAWRRKWGGKVVGITGSNGKTTTREMVHHLLSAHLPCKRSPKSFNTSVGVPLTLFQVEPQDKALVVEMGTNAPGEIAELAAIAEPDMGVITCIAETHLEGLGSVEGVANAKAELLDALGPGKTAFLNADDEWFDFLAARHRGRVVAYGFGPKAQFRADGVVPADGNYAYLLGGIPVRLNIPGKHNVLNSLAALAVARQFEMDPLQAIERLAGFRLPEMRFQVEHIQGVCVAFDCYNANPGSMRSALETFREISAPGRKVAVVGDMLELGPASEKLHETLGSHIAQSGVDALWAVGRYGSAVARAAESTGLRGVVRHNEQFEAVAEEICEYLKPGDALLVKGSRGMRLERLVEKLRAAAQTD